jgi:hypothetical protein
MTAAEIHEQLILLRLERFAAESNGLSESEEFVYELDQELEDCRSAYVAAAVIEIAQFRAQLSGREPATG